MIVDLREFAVVTLTAAPTGLKIVARFIPTLTDIHPCAHWRSPMDMMRQG